MDYLVLTVLRDLLVHQDFQVNQDLMVLKERWVLLELRDHQAYPVLKATEAYLDQRGQMESKVLKENK